MLGRYAARPAPRAVPLCRRPAVAAAAEPLPAPGPHARSSRRSRRFEALLDAARWRSPARAAGAAARRGPALGRSVHARAAQPAGRAGAAPARCWRCVTFRPGVRAALGRRARTSPRSRSAALPRRQAEAMVEQVTGGKALPGRGGRADRGQDRRGAAVRGGADQDGARVGLLAEQGDRYELTGPLPPLAIPATLQDSLMARLDRLAPVKEVAQLGATLGREFSYELLRAVAPLDEATLQHALAQLVEAELLYQRGVPPAGDLHLQARADPGRGLPVAAEEHAAAAITRALPSAGRTVPRDGRRRSPSCSPPLHRGGPRRAGDRLLAAGGPARHRALGECRGIAHFTGAGGCWRPLPETPERAPAGARAADRPRRCR